MCTHRFGSHELNITIIMYPYLVEFTVEWLRVEEVKTTGTEEKTCY